MGAKRETVFMMVSFRGVWFRWFEPAAAPERADTKNLTNRDG
jgi:hypothetical protein